MLCLVNIAKSSCRKITRHQTVVVHIITIMERPIGIGWNGVVIISYMAYHFMLGATPHGGSENFKMRNIFAWTLGSAIGIEVQLGDMFNFKFPIKFYTTEEVAIKEAIQTLKEFHISVKVDAAIFRKHIVAANIRDESVLLHLVAIARSRITLVVEHGLIPTHELPIGH